MEALGADRSTAQPARARWLSLGLFALAVVGALAGIYVLWVHVTTDPLADVRAYYDAGARLNAGEPLYPAGADPDVAEFYRYPPLLAILFRPMAFLPFDAAAAIWEVLILAAFGLTLWRLGIKRPATWLAVGMLGIPIGWTLAIGQAQSIVTLLLTLGSPWAVALAGHMKLFPILVGIYWLARREWQSLRLFVAWTIGLGVLQLVLEPANTLAFLGLTNLGQVGAVHNFSAFVLSPILWAALVVIGIAITVRLGRTGWGWSAVVALSVFATPRLLTYMLMTLLACLRRPDGIDGGATAAKSGAPT
jgi:Glycosyltransferase family 87